MEFGKWSIDDTSEEYVKRFKSAKSASCTPLGIRKDVGFAVFSGRHGVYNTTLESCNCFDFADRSTPCKHILRLAMEMGLIECDYDSDLDAVKYPQQLSFTQKTVYVDTSTGEMSADAPIPEGPLNELTFVITGVFESFTRDEMINMIRKYGGRVSSSVSRRTSYLVAGKDAGSKLSKANEYGIPVISDADLLNILKNSGVSAE